LSHDPTVIQGSLAVRGTNLPVGIAFLLSLVAAEAGLAAGLDWEVERNFRFFQYNSDVALQRIAFDLFEAEQHKKPNPEELEKYLNGPGFWSKPLSSAGALRDAWPKAWLKPQLDTPRALIRELRDREGSRSRVPDAQTLGRRGWSSLLVRPQADSHPDGQTDTCWSTIRRKHSNCDAYGDYVRPRGWIVRVFDKTAPQNATCSWRGDRGAYVGQASEATVHKKGGLHTKTGPWQSPPNQDCSEARVYVPSDVSDPRKVKGSATIVRRAADGTETDVTVTPQDMLIVGFADSFGSGEGNPEQGALFADFPIAVPNTVLPARSSPDAWFPAERAQWTDRWCHRSVYSWQIRSALHLSQIDANRKQSITVLPYGCSGAEVFEGILYNFGGVENTPNPKATGHPAQLGLAYQELCKTYYKAGDQPGIKDQPDWQTDDALRRAVRNGKTIDFSQARKEQVLQYVWRNIARCERNGPNEFRFKRDVDYVLMVIGINDIGFAKWVAGAISDKPIVDVMGGFIPRTGDPETEMRLERLRFRYGVFREALDQRFLVDAGLLSPGSNNGSILSKVLLPLYPRGLEDEAGNICAHGNQGMTVGTFPGAINDARQCLKRGLGFNSGIFSLFNVKGTVFAIRNRDDMDAIETFRDKHLNGGLADFAATSPSRPGYTVTLAPSAADGAFAKRGFCATRDPDSAITEHKCLAFDAFKLGPPPTCFPNPANCIARSAESLHIPRGPLAGVKPEWIGVWRPFGPNGFHPYAHRTRLFRTPNDVYVLINGRPSGSLDTTLPGVLDLGGRTTSGAFHPTAEGHAIIAKMIMDALAP
jgi:hypothetical protein